MTIEDELQATMRASLMATTDEIAMMREQHFAHNGACWECGEEWPCPVVTLLAALDAAQAALREIAAHQPYPDDIWIPLTAEEQQTLHAAMLATTVRHPLDRLYAGWGRQVLAQTAALATQALNGGEQ